MESTYWQDLEALDDAELDEDYDEADFLESDEGERAIRRFGPSPYRPMAPMRGIRVATINTPAGSAKLKLPAPVPTVREVGRVRRQVASSRGEIDKLRRKVRRLERQGTFGANLAIVANVIGQLKDTFMDVYVARELATANGLDRKPTTQPSQPSPTNP